MGMDVPRDTIGDEAIVEAFFTDYMDWMHMAGWDIARDHAWEWLFHRWNPSPTRLSPMDPEWLEDLEEE